MVWRLVGFDGGGLGREGFVDDFGEVGLWGEIVGGAVVAAGGKVLLHLFY